MATTRVEDLVAAGSRDTGTQMVRDRGNLPEPEGDDAGGGESRKDTNSWRGEVSGRSEGRCRLRSYDEERKEGFKRES